MLSLFFFSTTTSIWNTQIIHTIFYIQSTAHHLNTHREGLREHWYQWHRTNREWERAGYGWNEGDFTFFFLWMSLLFYFNSFQIGFMYFYVAPPHHDQSCRIPIRIFFTLPFSSFSLLAEPKKYEEPVSNTFSWVSRFPLHSVKAPRKLSFKTCIILYYPALLSNKKLYPYPNPPCKKKNLSLDALLLN